MTMVAAGWVSACPCKAGGVTLIYTVEPEARMAYIVIVAGPHRGEVKPLLQDYCIISRDQVGADQLNLGNDEYVSRADHNTRRPGHAQIQKIREEWRLTDCGSLNKTWVILNGAFNPLAARAYVRMSRAFLFGCGMSGLLFLDLQEEPWADLRKALCRMDQLRSFHPTDAPTPTKVLAGTHTNPAPLSDQAAALVRWAHIIATLDQYGLGDLR